MENFSTIDNREAFASHLKIKISHLTYLLYKVGVDNCYMDFKIPKSTGGYRIISSPSNELKAIQSKLLKFFEDVRLNAFKNPLSHAFQKNKSIITNAKIHINKKYVINIDLLDFYGSFNFGRVQGFFHKNKHFLFPKNIATVIAQICCYNGVLPQGAPTSPIITDLITRIMDRRILSLSTKYKLNYTRYADDLTFSTNDKLFEEKYQMFLEDINEIITGSGFNINTKKTRLQYQTSRQQVTGLVVNKQLSIPIEYYKNTRAMANALYKNDVFFVDGEEKYLNHLEGRFAFIDQIEKNNNRIKARNKVNISRYKLTGREKEYQKFLFYKTFIKNTYPVIVTEGKTDINYLKAALKNMYKEYPKLITLNSSNQFEFKIDFLRKSKKLQYFFGMSIDGGDSMTNLHEYLKSNNKTNAIPNYFKYFEERYSLKRTNPIFYLFDNEVEIKDKPISKFLSKYKDLYKNAKVELKNKGISTLEDNLYLMINQLINQKKECEIEDLFSLELLQTIINGKSFNRKDSDGSKSYYGKAAFSEYVLKNYKTVDFSNFKYILDNINSKLN